MDRLMDRHRASERRDDFDSASGEPVLVTHLTKYEKQAAATYTRAVFRLVKKEINKECTLTTVEMKDDHEMKLFKVRTFGLSPNEFTTSMMLRSQRITCSCQHLETSGIPCSHSIAVMKAENMTSIPDSMIWKRWTKMVKIGMHRNVRDNCYVQNLSGQARVGSLHAACRGLYRFAEISVEAYDLSIAKIHKLSMKLQSMCETVDGHSAPPTNRNGTVVKDPVVVLTKGGNKKQKLGTPQGRKCGNCGCSGHNARKCRNRGKTIQPTAHGDMHDEQLVCTANGLLPQSECGTSQAPPDTTQTNINLNPLFSQNQLRVPLVSCSDPWLDFIMTECDSTPTLHLKEAIELDNSFHAFCKTIGERACDKPPPRINCVTWSWHYALVSFVLWMPTEDYMYVILYLPKQITYFVTCQ
ncbi:hypothetical protein AB3S75_037428 [Citrus x aurantiifolia]